MLATGDPESWQGFVDVLISNYVNLMKSTEELIKDAKIAAVNRPRTGGECSPCVHLHACV